MNSIRFVTGVVLAAAASACGVSSEASMEVVETAEESLRTTGAAQAELRVVHASATTKKVDIYLSGGSTPVVRNLAFGATTGYLKLPAGVTSFDVREFGAWPYSRPLYSTGPLTLQRGKKYTAIATGDTGSSRPADKFRVLPLVEAFGRADNQQARVRVVHASSDAPTVGIDVGDDNPAAAEVSALARFADTGAAGLPLPAGQALQLGVGAGGDRVTAFTTPALAAGSNLFVIAVGSLKGTSEYTEGLAPSSTILDLDGRFAGDNEGQPFLSGLSLLVVGPSGTVGFLKQNPIVYTLHASPDAPSVDVFSGPSRLIAGLSYGRLSAGLRLPPGNYDLDLFGAGTASRPAGASAFSFSSGELQPGGRYLVAATGFFGAVGGQEPFGVTALEATPELSTRGRRDTGLQFLHAIGDVPRVSVNVADLNFSRSAFAFGAVASLRSPLDYELGSAIRTVVSTGVTRDLQFTAKLPKSGFAVFAGSGLGTGASRPRLITVDAGDSTRGYLGAWTATSTFGTPAR